MPRIDIEIYRGDNMCFLGNLIESLPEIVIKELNTSGGYWMHTEDVEIRVIQSGVYDVVNNDIKIKISAPLNVNRSLTLYQRREKIAKRVSKLLPHRVEFSVEIQLVDPTRTSRGTYRGNIRTK